MNKKILFLTTCGLALTFASPALSQTFNAAEFLGIDRDASNLISRGEATDFRLRYFDVLDLDNNGTVDYEEYVTANKLRSSVAKPDSPVPVTPEYKEADVNGDTLLSKQEFLAVGEKRFAMLDKNNDGSLSKEEFVAPGL